MDPSVRKLLMLKRARVIIKKEGKYHLASDVSLAARLAMLNPRFRQRVYHWVWRHYERGGK